MRAVSCRVCHRILVDGEWIEDDGRPHVSPGWLCAMCNVQIEASRELGRKLAIKNARADRRRGKKYGESVSDPFRGF